jgi:hypothetical protein
MADIPTPDRVALVRARYRAGASLRAIHAETGLSRTAIHQCLAGDYDDGSGAPPPPIALRRGGTPAGPMRRTALVARLWQSAEQQVEQIEARLARIAPASEQRDGDMRAFATLVKTLRELSAFDEAHQPRARKRKTEQDDDPVPRDIDEFRRELARRMDAFVQSRTGARVPGDPEGELA